jgi:hypothetical protein
MSIGRQALLAVALAVQLAVCVRVDDEVSLSAAAEEDPPPEDADAEKVAKARKALNEAAQNVAATVSKVQKTKEDSSPPVVFAPPAPPPIVVPMKPAIIFAHEGSALVEHIKMVGLLDYDRDGSGNLDAMEFAPLLGDAFVGQGNSRNHLKSDSEVEKVLKKFDKDDDDRLNKVEVLVFLDSLVGKRPARVPADRCSGWSPADGEDKGHGASCDKWGWMSFWCFVPKDYQGPGAGSRMESLSNPGKFFALCDYVEGVMPANPGEDKEAKQEEVLKAAESKVAGAAEELKQVVAEVGPDKVKKDKKDGEEKEAAKKMADAKLNVVAAASVAGDGSIPPSSEVQAAFKKAVDAATEMAEVAKDQGTPKERKEACQAAIQMIEAAISSTPTKPGSEPSLEVKAAQQKIEEIRKEEDETAARTTPRTPARTAAAY